jgi:quercetin dioxygenase-like cupin family protein
MPRGVAHGDVVQNRVAGFAVRPEQERGGLHRVHVGLAGADVARFLGGCAERQRLGARIIRDGEAVGAGQRDLARDGVAAEQRAERRAVIEEEAAEDGVGARARPKPRRPLGGPRSGARIVAVPGGEPEHPVPEAAGPVAGGRRRPRAGDGIGEVREAARHRLRGACDAAAHAGQRIRPGRGHCARILPLLRCGTTSKETAMSVMKGFHTLRDLPQEKVTDKISRRILMGEKEMIVWWTMKAGAHAAAHRHPHEQLFWMISGRMDFRLGAERRTCGPGDLAVIPGGVEHEAWFPEDTEVIDVFSPPREDFLPGAGAPAYMRTAP